MTPRHDMHAVPQSAAPSVGTAPAARSAVGPARVRPALTVHAAAVIFGLVYAACCPRDVVSFGDSCDLVTASHLLVPAHPPGFPLYVVLGKACSSLFSFVDCVYVRYAMMTILFSVLTLDLVMLLTLRMTSSLPVALLAGGFLGLSREFWMYAVVPEAFSLNALLAALLLMLAAVWHRGGDPRTIVAAAFVGGLGATNHWTLLTLGPGIAASLAWRKPSWRVLAACATAFAVGLSAVLVLFPLLERDGPLLFPTVATWQGFVDVVLRRRYGMVAAASSEPRTLQSVTYFFRSLGGQYSLPGLALALLGAWHLVRRDASWLFLPVGFLLAGPCFIFLMNIPGDSVTAFGMMERFHVLPLVLLAPLLASGVARVWDLCSGRAGRFRRVLAAGLCTVMLGWLVVRNWSACDRFDDVVTRSFTTMVLDGLPDGATLLTYNDTETFAVAYALHVDGNPHRILHLPARGIEPVLASRPQVKRYVRRQGLPDSIDVSPATTLVFLRRNVDRTPVYATYHAAANACGSGPGAFAAIPGRGLAFRIVGSPLEPTAPDADAALFHPAAQQLQLSVDHFNNQMNLVYFWTMARQVCLFRSLGRPDWADMVMSRCEQIIPSFDAMVRHEEQRSWQATAAPTP